MVTKEKSREFTYSERVARVDSLEIDLLADSEDIEEHNVVTVVVDSLEIDLFAEKIEEQDAVTVVVDVLEIDLFAEKDPMPWEMSIVCCDRASDDGRDSFFLEKRVCLVSVTTLVRRSFRSFGPCLWELLSSVTIEDPDCVDSVLSETPNELQESAHSLDQLQESTSAMHAPRVSSICTGTPCCSKSSMNSGGGAGGALAPEGNWILAPKVDDDDGTRRPLLDLGVFVHTGLGAGCLLAPESACSPTQVEETPLLQTLGKARSCRAPAR